MKKLIASKKWLITYLIILAFLSCFIALGIALIIYSAVENSTEALAIGIVTLVYILPVAVIILFYLNRRACLIWVEDGLFKWKGLLFGFSGSIKPEEIADVFSGNKTIYIYLSHPKKHTHFKKGIFELSNTLENRTLLKSFYSGEVYPPELCDTCKNIKTGEIETPEEYLNTLSHLNDLIKNENYEMFIGKYPIDAVQDENGKWVDDSIYHEIKCKKCGAHISCDCDTYHGRAYLKVGK